MGKKDDGVWHRRRQSSEGTPAADLPVSKEVSIAVDKLLAKSNAKVLYGLKSRKTPLGGTGPKPWFDRYPPGGNANPKRRRSHPSGHHNCG